MLEVPHLHITLTTDNSFRPFFRRDSRLLKELLRLGAQAVQEVLSDIYTGMQIGLVYTVHTFGRDLGYKPHVHLVITKGGLVDVMGFSRNGWISGAVAYQENNQPATGSGRKLGLNRDAVGHS